MELLIVSIIILFLPLIFIILLIPLLWFNLLKINNYLRKEKKGSLLELAKLFYILKQIFLFYSFNKKKYDSSIEEILGYNELKKIRGSIFINNYNFLRKWIRIYLLIFNIYIVLIILSFIISIIFYSFCS